MRVAGAAADGAWPRAAHRHTHTYIEACVQAHIYMRIAGAAADGARPRAACAWERDGAGGARTPHRTPH